MMHLILSEELIERLADTYQNQTTGITFQQFFELEWTRLKESIA